MNLLEQRKGHPINTFIVPFVFPDYIQGCVESIWKYCNLEEHRLIVVDNSDLRIDMVDWLIERSHLYIHSYRNLGCSKSWNIGPQLSHTKYITIMGDDTRIIHKNWWPEVYQYIGDGERSLTPGVWFCHPCHLTQPSKVGGQLEPPEFTDAMWEEAKKKSGDMPGRFNALIIRQDTIKRVSAGDNFLFNEDLYPCEQVDGAFKDQLEVAGLPMLGIHFPVWHMRAMSYQSGKLPSHDRGKSHPSYKQCPKIRRYL